MKIIKIDLKKISRTEVNLIIDYLRQGKVVIYPTDTIYGLGCIATDKKAINKIYKIKKRNKKKPLLILVSSLAMLKRHCYVSRKQEEYLRKVWNNLPQPLLGKEGSFRAVSVILKSRGLLPRNLTGGTDSIAVRLPRNKLLIKIIRQINTPIVSTSLNISGKKNLSNISKIDTYFSRIKPDLAIDVGNLAKKPSKLIDLRDLNNIKVLRK
jgi:L-threonylcarbamoyladenylate synthase